MGRTPHAFIYKYNMLADGFNKKRLFEHARFVDRCFNAGRGAFFARLPAQSSQAKKIQQPSGREAERRDFQIRVNPSYISGFPFYISGFPCQSVSVIWVALPRKGRFLGGPLPNAPKTRKRPPQDWRQDAPLDSID